jgi:hypothetical protein
MRRPLLLLIIIIPTSILFSQQESVLKDFKFRNANYRAISFRLNGSGIADNTNYQSGRLDQYVIGFSGAFQFQQMKSTDKQLFNFIAGLTPSYSSATADNFTDKNKSRYFSISPQVYLNNKWFSKKMFTELGVESFANFTGGRNRFGLPVILQKTNTNYASFAIILGIGKGRLENITDMQNALWLNKSLEEAGRLSHVLTPTELNELGKSITKGNNTRVLDARKRTQFILETIDNYFQENGLINKTDIKYFSNLNDIVFFAFNDPRLSGTEKFIRLKPFIEKFDHSMNESPTDNRTEIEALNYSALLSIGINRHLPKNLKHQNDFGIAAELKYQSNDYNARSFYGGNPIGVIDMESAMKQAGLSGFFKHGIYPNSRTLINFQAEARGGYQDLEGESSGYFSSQLQASWNYFISYRTRLTCNVAAQYQKNIYTSSSTYYLDLRPENITVLANFGIEVNL